MAKYLNPHLTVAQAGPVLEQEFRARFGTEYERLYRTLHLQIAEHTRTDEAQVFAITALLGRTHDQTMLFLALVWLANKQSAEPEASRMLDEIRTRQIGDLLCDAQRAIQIASPSDQVEPRP